jgi:CRP-like cAMP-binding protein
MATELSSCRQAINRRSEPSLKTAFSPFQNLILRSLSREAYARFLPHLEAVSLTAGDVLSEPGLIADQAYFINTGMVSVLAVLRDGDSLEVGIIGREGVVDANMLLGCRTSLNRVIVQVDATALRMKSSVLTRLYNEASPQFRSSGQRYIQYRMGQMSQSAICSHAHGIEERLARWLLMTADTVNSDRFFLTHEFLSQMIGARRSSVTLAAGTLSVAGIIQYHRGRIVILKRKSLEELACECYGILKREYASLATS